MLHWGCSKGLYIRIALALFPSTIQFCTHSWDIPQKGQCFGKVTWVQPRSVLAMPILRCLAQI